MDSTAMADSCASHSELIRIAESNTRALHQVYPEIPHDDYPTFAAMEAAVEQHGSLRVLFRSVFCILFS